MFQPPRCPNPTCSRHRSPEPGFFRRRGFYWPACRAHPVPRFTCRSCGRGFSRQSFRSDYRDHRPDLNAGLLRLLASGLGLRQSARLLGLSRRCTELKFRKIATHLRDFNLNLRGELAEGVTLQFDEFETYEGRRNTRPLTIPTLIERETRFVLWAESAPIRPRGRMTPSRLAAIAREDVLHGTRRDRSRASIERTLSIGRLSTRGRLVLQSDI
jgi:transposase-like protein